MKSSTVQKGFVLVVINAIAAASSLADTAPASSTIAPSVQANEIEFEPKCLSDKTQLDPSTPASGKVVAPRVGNKPPIPPEVPLEIQKAGEHGTLVLGVYVTEKGQVAKARILQSTGSARLDDLTLKGARNWRFVAGSIDGTKACMWIPLRFVYLDPKNPPTIPR